MSATTRLRIALVLALAAGTGAIARHLPGIRAQTGSAVFMRATRSPAPVLLIVLHSRDCDAAGATLHAWSAAAARGGVVTLGVQIDDGPPSPLPFRTEQRHAAAAARLLLRLGHRHTPAAVLLDGMGRPRAVLTPGATPRADALAAIALERLALTLQRADFNGERP